MELATPTQRLIGQFLDALIAFVPFLIVVFVTARYGETAVVAARLLPVLWALFYYFLADGLNEGQSFGKQWVGIRVVSAETGAPCTFGQSFIRNVILSALGPIDWLFIFGHRRQRLGDRAAGTIVIVDPARP